MSDVIYVGHDASLSFQLFDADGESLDLTVSGENIQRVSLHLASTAIDSHHYPASFDWQSEGASGLIAIDLTGFEFPVGAHGARLVIYSGEYPLGLVVADGYPVRVGEALGTLAPPTPDEATLRVELADTQRGSDLVAWKGSGFTVSQGLDTHGSGLGDHEGRIASLEATPEKALVSGGDTVPGFLTDKLVAGTDITLTATDPGGNEKLEIAVSGRDHMGTLVFVQLGQVPNYVWTAINFTNVVHDLGDFFDAATSQTRMTVPAEVTKARLTAQLTFERNVTGERSVQIRKNGAVIPFIDPLSAAAATSDKDTGVQVCTPVLDVVQGDYFEVYAFQNSGVALYKASYGNWFSIEAIR